MNLKRHERRLFSEREFRDGSRLERIYIYLMNPDRFQISEKEEEYLNLMKQAFSILSNTLSQAEAVKKIEALDDVDYSQASIYNLINNVRSLFGSMINTQKQFDRMVLIERHEHLYKQAMMEDPPDLFEARRNMEAISQIKGLDKHDVDTIDPEELKLPGMEWTNDPKALEEAEEAEIVEE